MESNMIKVTNKAGRITHFNRESFLKIKKDKDGRRNGWIEYDENNPAQSVSDMSGVPPELKVFKGKAKIYSQEELDEKVSEALRKDRQERADVKAAKLAEGKNKTNEPIDVRATGGESGADIPEIKLSSNTEDKNSSPESMLTAAGANTKDGTINVVEAASGSKEKSVGKDKK